MIRFVAFALLCLASPAFAQTGKLQTVEGAVSAAVAWARLPNTEVHNLQARWRPELGLFCIRLTTSDPRGGRPEPRFFGVRPDGAVSEGAQVCSFRRPAAVDVEDFRRLLVSDLAARKRYPEEARASGAEGRVVVRFEARTTGQVTGVQIVTGSGSAELDTEALALVLSLTVPIFPPGFSGDTYRTAVPISFMLRPPEPLPAMGPVKPGVVGR